MEFEIDYQPTPSKMFFISVSINDKEAISFDYTTKAHRIIKQVLRGIKKFPKNAKTHAKWDSLIFEGGKFVKKYHVKWIDLKEKDWCNDEIWETVWEKPISETLAKKLLEYSRFISDNYLSLDKKKINEFENFIKKEVKKVWRNRQLLF